MYNVVDKRKVSRPKTHGNKQVRVNWSNYGMSWIEAKRIAINRRNRENMMAS